MRCILPPWAFWVLLFIVAAAAGLLISGFLWQRRGRHVTRKGT